MTRVRTVEVNPPSIVRPTIFTVVFAMVWYLLSTILSALQGPIGGQLAVDQVNGGDEEWVISHIYSTGNWGGAILVVTLVLISITWAIYLRRYVVYKNTTQEVTE